MDTNSLITLEELLGWRELDRWRRAKGFREMNPHQGFHGIRPIVGCHCCTCATKWHMTDEERVEKHNAKIETPLKKAFLKTWVEIHGSGCDQTWNQHYAPKRVAETTQSLSRAAILKDIVRLEGKWSDPLPQGQREQEFIKQLIGLISTLVSEKNNRITERMAKPAYKQDWGLRRYVPIGKPKKEWAEL